MTDMPEDAPVEPDPVGPAPTPEQLSVQPLLLKPDRGVLILVLGILGIASTPIGLACCAVIEVIPLTFGIVAWVMGNRDLKEMQSGLMDAGNRGLTQAGLVCGIIATVLGGLGLLAHLVWVLLWGVIMFAGAAAETCGPSF